MACLPRCRHALCLCDFESVAKSHAVTRLERMLCPFQGRPHLCCGDICVGYMRKSTEL